MPEYLNSTGYLHDQLLVATQAVQDGCFDRSVIYLAAHNESGAMGIIVNMPLPSVEVDSILRQLHIPFGTRIPPIHTQFGGPVESSRGYILHEAALADGESLKNPSGICLSATKDVLARVVELNGACRHMLAFGCAAWGKGQLESEIEEGSWHVVPSNPTLIFDTENELKWNMANSSLGFDLDKLLPHVGHA